MKNIILWSLLLCLVSCTSSTTQSVDKKQYPYKMLLQHATGCMDIAYFDEHQFDYYVSYLKPGDTNMGGYTNASVILLLYIIKADSCIVGVGFFLKL